MNAGEKKGRPRRRGGFGYIVSKGTTTHPLFAVRWREGSRHKQLGGFETKKAAADELAAIRAGMADGTLLQKRRAEVSFASVAKDWLKLHSAPNLRSHGDNAQRYATHVEPFFGETPIGQVTAKKLLEFRAGLQTKPISRRLRQEDGEVRDATRKMAARTVNLCMALVRSILNFAVEGGLLTVSPTRQIGRGKLMLSVPKEQIAPPIPTAAKAGALLAALREIGEEQRRPSIYPMLATLLYTGMRRGEAASLRWFDVDFDRRLVTIRGSYDSTTKSKRHRSAPLAPELVAILREYRVADPWKGDLVFPNDAGEMYKPGSKVPELTLRAGLERVGLQRIRVHDLRHALASFFMMAGGNLFDLQKILGHSTPQLVSDTYAHLSPAHLASQADRISFPAPPPPADVIPIAKRVDSARAVPLGESSAANEATNS